MATKTLTHTWQEIDEGVPARDFHSFKFSKVKDVLDIPETWTQLNALTETLEVCGIYNINMAVNWTFDTATKSVFMRYTLDGGTTWFEDFAREAKDKTDKNAVYYAFPIEATNPNLDLRIEVRKETGSNTFNVLFCDLWVERKH
jgi:hypothetical protein